MKKLLWVPLVLSLAACGISAPNYNASIPNVEAAKAGAPGAKVSVGEFKSEGKAESMSLRGNPLSSPNGTFARYIEESLKRELELAGLIAKNTDVIITGTLLKQDIDTGISKASGEISVRFIVNQRGQVRYDAVKHARHEWDSSFVGAVAIPKAAQEYSMLVQKLLSTLYADAQFMKAIQ